jgi:anti-sigma B factor antagonist
LSGDIDPWKLPIAVRIAPEITISRMAGQSFLSFAGRLPNGNARPLTSPKTNPRQRRNAMDFACNDSGDMRLIAVDASRIDAAVAIQFKDGLREMTMEGPMRVVLDLSQVSFIDSSGLGAVVAAMKQLEGGRRLELAALTPNVQKVFRLTRMDRVFTIHPSTANLVNGLRDAG